MIEIYCEQNKDLLAVQGREAPPKLGPVIQLPNGVREEE
jgi:hypothetical protein